MSSIDHPDLVTLKGAPALAAFAGFYADPISCAEKLYRLHGPAIAIEAPFLKPAGVPQGYFFVGPEFNKAILLDQEHLRPTGAWPTPGRKGQALENLRRNILCLRGAEHDAQLSAILPLTGKSHVRSLFDAAREIVSEEVGAWPQDAVVDVVNLARGLTQRLAFELLFGAQSADESLAFGKRVDAFHQKSWSRGALFFRVNAPMTPYHALIRAAEELEAYAVTWSNAAKGCPAHSNVRAAIANTVVANGESISDTQIAANMAAVGMAAYETTALTLSWMLFFLTQHPETLSELIEEIETSPPIGEIDEAALDRLPLLDGVVKETLRLVSPVPFIGFEVMENCSIAGMRFHEKSRIFISPHLTHRIESIYERPREFLPERWSAIKPSAYEYFPFNAGPRRCPGIWFASANLKIILATILSQFQISLAPAARIDRGYAATTIPKKGVPMIFSCRNGTCTRSNCKGTIMKFFDVRGAA